jgi:mannose-6-phosphate isomerase-like protein (cupin superfamily)
MSGILIPVESGKPVQIGGMGVVYKLFGQDTGGSFSIVEHPLEPGTLATPHMHVHEDEFSFVLEGEVGVRVGDQVIVATPGSYVLKPRGVPHTFWNAGPKPARIIEIISPAGFEKYFEELAELIGAGGPPDRSKLAALAERYGLTYHLEWIPELVARYNLKSPRADK